MNILQKSIKAGINLRGTKHEGISAERLHKADPQLAGRWSDFIGRNKKQIVQEITSRLSRYESYFDRM